MKLTKLQRYTAYIILLEEFKAQPNGICLIWYYLFEEIRWQPDEDHLSNILPELWEKATNKSLDSCESWWPNDKDRVKSLKKCIIETHP